MKSELEQILSLLSGDLNYDQVAKAKGIVKQCLKPSKPSGSKPKLEVTKNGENWYAISTGEAVKPPWDTSKNTYMYSNEQMALNISERCKKVIFQFSEGAPLTIRVEGSICTCIGSKLYLDHPGQYHEYNMSDKKIKTVCLYYEDSENENFYFFQRINKSWDWEGQEFTPPALPFLTLGQ